MKLPWRRERVLQSILPSGLRRLLTAAVVLAAFMLANTLYLLINRLADAINWRFFSVGETSLPKLFQTMVLTHTGIGILLAVLMVVFLVAHLPRVWKRYHKASAVSGVFYAVVGVILVITGLFILTAAASRDNRWAWWAHVSAAALVPLGYVAHRLVSYARPRSVAFTRFFVAVGVLAVVLGIVHGLTRRDIVLTEEAQLAAARGLNTGPGSKARNVGDFVDSEFVPAGLVPPASPFFPSAATTTSGGYLPSRIITRGNLGTPANRIATEIEQYGFVKDALIGAETCVRCHQDIVGQWATSAHRFASFNNPFYEATINDMRSNATEPNEWVASHIEAFPDAEGVGFVKSKWCSGCHDPALMLAGKMDRPIDRASLEAQAGLTCLACHAIDGVHGRTGNGNYNIADEQEDPYVFAEAFSGTWGAFLHDAALKAKPTVHKRQMLRPFFRESEFCATCHKVSLTEPVNNYRWLRGQNEFDNWDDSGVSLNASRTFYLPDQRRVCQDCHMPPEPAPLGDVAAKGGMVRSHRFLAVNTALPFIRGDDETIERIEAFLRNEKLSVDIFAVTNGSRGTAVMAADLVQPGLTVGERVTVDVVVRNKGVGHTFPGGTNDSNEGWLEFTVLDAETGEVLGMSGTVQADGHLDPMAHVYKAVIVDRDGEPIHRRNAQDIHVTVFANVIGPGTADIAHYEFDLPPSMAGRRIGLRARLLWRKFDRAYTEFAFNTNREGFKRFDHVPSLPITEIAADELELLAVPQPSGVTDAEARPVRGDWVRFNDYGIGLLLEGNTRGAFRAFSEVARLAPDQIDGPLNLARTVLQDGNIESARSYLQQSEAIEPANARAAWVWGQTLQEQGDYDNAVLAYKRVLELFPRDRAAWRNLGRTYYLNQQYEEAVAALDQVLDIDPEDRIAHYHQMLSYRAMNMREKADVSAAAYALYSVDESAQEITRAFRARNPGVNLMAQDIPIHRITLAQ